MAEKKKRNWVNAGPGLGTALGTGLGAASGLHGGRKAYKSAKALRGLGVAAKLKKRRALWHLLERAVTGGGAGWLVGSTTGSGHEEGAGEEGQHVPPATRYSPPQAGGY